MISWRNENDPHANNVYIVLNDPSNELIRAFAQIYERAFESGKDIEYFRYFDSQQKVHESEWFLSSPISAFIQSSASDRIVALRGNGVQVFCFAEGSNEVRIY